MQGLSDPDSVVWGPQRFWRCREVLYIIKKEYLRSADSLTCTISFNMAQTTSRANVEPNAAQRFDEKTVTLEHESIQERRVCFTHYLPSFN